MGNECPLCSAGTTVQPASRTHAFRLSITVDQLLRFAGIGTGAMVLYLALFAVLGPWMPAVLANVIGWSVSTLGANELQRRWAFGVIDAHTHRADQAIALTASLIGLALSTVILANVPDGFSSLAGIAIILLINLIIGSGRFILMRWWLISRHA